MICTQIRLRSKLIRLSNHIVEEKKSNERTNFARKMTGESFTGAVKLILVKTTSHKLD